MTNKKKTYLLLFLFIAILIIAFLAFNSFEKKDSDSNENNSNETETTFIPYTGESGEYIPQPLPLVWMTLAEKNEFGISTTTDSRIQILARSEDGKVAQYKIIRKDEDIVSEY